MGGFDTFEVKTTAGDFEARSVILATGSRRASARIPGVKEFEGKGVSYCAVCDAFFTEEKKWQCLETVILLFMKQKNFLIPLPV